MKIPSKHSILLAMVALALISLFLPMLWEKNLYPKHMQLHRRAAAYPQANISQIPAFPKLAIHDQNSISITAWMVQVGEPQSLTQAIQLRQQLRQRGYASFLSSVAANSTPAQVLVGPYSQEDLAKAAKQTLQEQLNLKANVITYNPTTMKEIVG